MLGNVSTKGFEKFLVTLDPDLEKAAGIYLSLRGRLERFFEWRDCDNPEGLTDIVFDRVTKKIIEGEEIQTPEAYCVTVAKYVLMENRRAVLKSEELDENSKEISSRNDEKNEDDEDEIRDKHFKCLDKCLEEFPKEKRELLVGYFDTDEETMIGTRKRLAEKVGVNLNTLRIRVSRLKSKLEKCTKKCCAES